MAQRTDAEARGTIAREGTPLARHARGARSSPLHLAGRLLASGRVHLVPLLLSDQARMVLARGFDAFTTDRAYEARPHGALGPIGALADRLVLSFPVHVALRQRLPIVRDALVEAVARAAASGADPVRVLSAPCGLLRDVLAASARLRDRVAVRWTGVDLDEAGDVLPEAGRRAAEAGLPIELLREDLFGPGTALEARVRRGGPFDAVSCIGLSPWVDLDDPAALVRRFHDLLARGGTLILDGWRPDRDATLARLLELPARYHDPAALEDALERAGFWIADARPTQNRACTVWIARRG